MDSHFQVVVLGTGLTESIAAAALAKAGLRVAHIDTNPYYGADEASLSTKELQECILSANGKKKYVNSGLSSASLRGKLPASSRDYSLSLSPSIVPSKGPLISALIGSGVARYGGFKLLESISVYSTDGFKNVPGSKEEIFKSKELSLIDKRRLMRFLMYAAGDFDSSPEVQGRESMPFVSFLEDVFSLNKQLASALSYALALCKSTSDPVLPALNRIKRYLRSAGRYGPSPFLAGQYGGLGELAQGFCRVCAVSGGTYILGRELRAVEINQATPSSAESKETKHFCLKLSDVPEDLTADVIVSSHHYLPYFRGPDESEGNSFSSEDIYAYCIVLVDSAMSRPSTAQSTSSTDEDTVEQQSDDADSVNQSKPVDAALLVFPPGQLSSGSASGPVNVLINGEGTLSCPRGKSVLYVSTMIQRDSLEEDIRDPDVLLRPYIDATLSLLRAPDGTTLNELSSTFYTRSRRSVPEESLASLREKGIFISPSLPYHVAEAGDTAATNGEVLFRDVLKRLGTPEAGAEEMWPALPGIDDDDDDNVL